MQKSRYDGMHQGFHFDRGQKKNDGEQIVGIAVAVLITVLVAVTRTLF